MRSECVKLKVLDVFPLRCINGTGGGPREDLVSKHFEGNFTIKKNSKKIKRCKPRNRRSAEEKLIPSHC